MSYINENFLNLQTSYFFPIISKKVAEFQKNNPDAKVIKLGIGDVTRPIPTVITNAMKNAVSELEKAETFRGYGPECGYPFLKEKIIEIDYKSKGIEFDLNEIFISDGIACDCGNIVDIFSENNTVAITDPVYPMYLDTNVMSGRSGKYNEKTGMFEEIIYLPVTAENNFVPQFPEKVPDMIYLCLPNNPTGTVLSKEQLKAWVDYAKKNKSIILFDAAYEAFISEKDIPHSIYEIEGAKGVAIEFKSFSKSAGFTGVRCGYTVIPNELKGYTKEGNEVSINAIWTRRHETKHNGVSYPVQRAAEAVYSKEGQEQIKENIEYYMNNAKIIKKGLKEAGFQVYGGDNAPYIWFKVPDGLTSWEFFDELLEKANVVGTPGSGFGPSGEGYFRLTAFGTKESTTEAIERIQKIYKK